LTQGSIGSSSPKALAHCRTSAISNVCSIVIADVVQAHVYIGYLHSALKQASSSCVISSLVDDIVVHSFQCAKQESLVKPGPRVVIHVHQFAELSKAQRKNSPQALSCTFGQDNLQKTPFPLVGSCSRSRCEGRGVWYPGYVCFPASPLIPVLSRSLQLGELTQPAQYLFSCPTPGCALSASGSRRCLTCSSPFLSTRGLGSCQWQRALP